MYGWSFLLFADLFSSEPSEETFQFDECFNWMYRNFSAIRPFRHSKCLKCSVKVGLSRLKVKKHNQEKEC